MPHTAPTISLCMIVRNEAKRLPQCLSSVSGLVQEIVVVDTGSTDDSVTIAKNFGAKVVKLRWADDFSHARNESLRHATGDWILVLDGDECLDRADHERIRGLLDNSQNRAWLMVQRHYTNDPYHRGFIPNSPLNGELTDSSLTESSLGYFEGELVRLFPNRLGIHFSNQVHELVEPAIHKLGTITIHNSEVRIHHYGYLESKRWTATKHALYTRLGAAKIANGEDSLKALAELSIELSAQNRFPEAINVLCTLLHHDRHNRDGWLNLGFAFGEIGLMPLAVTAIQQAIALDPVYAESHLNLGVIYLRQGELIKAAESFEITLRYNPEHLTATFNLGEVALCAGDTKAALHYFEQVIRRVPNHRRAHEGKARCFALLGDIEAITAQVAVVSKIPGDNGRFFLQLSIALRSAALESGGLLKKTTPHHLTLHPTKLSPTTLSQESIALLQEAQHFSQLAANSFNHNDPLAAILGPTIAKEQRIIAAILGATTSQYGKT